MPKGGERRQAKTPKAAEPRARRPEARATRGEPLPACLRYRRAARVLREAACDRFSHKTLYMKGRAAKPARPPTKADK